MTKTMRHGTILFLLACSIGAFSFHTASAQDVVPAPEARPSPMAVAQATLSDGTYIAVRYSSPRKRGRDIFGGLVPLDEVWRFGANEATEITVTQDVTFGGTRVPAGTYALFAIPSEDEWTLILNENLGQWGAFSYDMEADFARVTVPAEESGQIHEAFTVTLEVNDAETAATLSAVWDQTRISVPIQAIN
ncbi:MAG: DUF2911 domain-containing protein [Rhodothermales bacterium]